MRLFKKRKSAKFPLHILGDDNLAAALQNDSSPEYSFPVGKDNDGNYIFTDLKDYAHIIAAGQTGSGMAVFQDTMLVSLMYKNTPDALKFIFIDPKQVSLSPYKNSPYLQRPWIVDPKESELAIQWLLEEIERRFDILRKAGVNDIYEYNAKYKDKLFSILLVIDEVADLMMVNGRYYEQAFVKMMQVSRAVGIMSFIGTHRTSENVLPGLVRANSFTKIAFTLPNKESSEFIIDEPGAENLNGKGDLLFSSPASDSTKSVRLQAPYISNENLMNVLNYIEGN